ncbi:hypothetical protein [Metapseudomonas otitidis]|uniref:hypothetical protein n=1 Tax=Metapseudomonas otitidis TaxID=319939 RepID=UPI0013F5DF96|nr:hypothetical protein [Pseudomonas otitidis]
MKNVLTLLPEPDGMGAPDKLAIFSPVEKVLIFHCFRLTRRKIKWLRAFLTAK